MKKQFIAIILTVAMLVAMVPMLIVPASAFNSVTHTVPFVEADIVIDGECDEVYKSFGNTPIESKYSYSKTGVKFTAYSIATSKGLYLWIDINDTTFVNKDGSAGEDYIEFYVDMGGIDENPDDKNAIRIPSVRLDYDNKPSFKAHNVPYQINGKTATVKRDTGDNQGWSAEIFIEWKEGTPAANAVANGELDFYFGWGIQVNDDQTDDGKVKWTDLLFDSADTKGFSYYFDKDSLCQVKFTDDYKVIEEGGGSGFVGKYGAAFIDHTLAVDGNREYFYGKGTQIVNTLNTYGSKGNGEMFEAYVVATRKGFYLWADIKDTTLLNQVDDAAQGDYFQIYFNMGADSKATNAIGYVQFDYNNTKKFVNQIGGTVFTTLKTDTGWIAEVFVPWKPGSPAAQAAANGETDFFFSIGLQYNDDTNRATTDGGKPHRDEFYYDADGGIHYWYDYSTLSQVGFMYDDGNPTIPISEKISFSKVLSLGAAFTDPKMRYTLKSNGVIISTEVVDGIKVEGANNKYIFDYNVAPQYMRASFTAELMQGDDVFGTLEKDFSIYDYYVNLLSLSSDELGVSSNQYYAMQKLIYNTLNYGAAAQRYLGYNTDNLANKGYEDKAPVFGGIGNYTEIHKEEALEGYNTEFVSMGLNFDSANRMYVKFRATEDEISKIKVTFIDDYQVGIAPELEIYKVADEEDTYIAYSPYIAPEDYDVQYTFRLIYDDSEVVQRVYCNVNAYLAEIIEESDNYYMIRLAQATYLYGTSVKAYKVS